MSERHAFVEEFIKQQHSQAHDAGMQAQDHAHERALVQQQQDADSMSQASDQAHQIGMRESQRQQRRKPARCQPLTVAGFTMTRTSAQRGQ